MKKSQLIIAAILGLTSLSVRADLASYQAAVSGQSPGYDFHFDNSYVDSVGGTAAFTANGGATFGPDYWGNGNSAALLPTNTDYLSIASPVIIAGEGTSNAVGALSMLFYLPNTVPNTGYLFSDTDTGTSSLFAFDISGSSFQLKVGNKTFTLTGAPAPTSNTWYYLGLTYNLNGVVTGVNGVDWYMGAAGGSLANGFIQKGGSGNLSATTTLGDGGPFILDNRRAFNNGMGLNSEVDELATWSTQLSASQIQNQYNSLVIPEPSTCALVGIGILISLCFRRKMGACSQR